MARIAEAIEVMASDPSVQRTKRQLERTSGLSHDAVARAFRQDAAEPDNPYRLTDRFADVTGPTASGRSRDGAQADHDEVVELKDRVSELDRQLDRYAATTLAYYLRVHQPDLHQTVVPLRRRRRRDPDSGPAR